MWQSIQLAEYFSADTGQNKIRWLIRLLAAALVTTVVNLFKIISAFTKMNAACQVGSFSSNIYIYS